MVYVLNQDGKPIMPTNRHGHVRYLLKHHKAVVACRNPFTIKLLYQADETQPVILGIDPGRTNIGICAVKDNGKILITANVQTRNKDIPKLMKKRAEHRRNHRNLNRRRKRQRRAKQHKTVFSNPLKRHLPGYGEDKTIICNYIKNKQARFCNRKRPDGWLTPTANHLLQTHLNIIHKITKFLPIHKINLELNKFAFMRLDDPSVHGRMFQNGLLKGFNHDVKQAVYAFQSGKCLLCNDDITCYHHVIERSKNGNETVRNRVGLCGNCHAAVHKHQSIADKLRQIASGQRKKYDALGVLNQIIPRLLTEISQLYPVSITTGYATKAFREKHNLSKDHFIDAYAIACHDLIDPEIPDKIIPMYQIRQFRRHDRQICEREMLNRNYMLNGKKVAVNRHKAIGQMTDSLEEFVAKGGCTSRLTVKHMTKAMKNPNRVLPGAQIVRKHCVDTMVKRGGGYHWFDTGYKIRNTKTVFDRLNTGLVFVSNTIL